MGRKKGTVPIISIDSASGMDIMMIKKTNRPDFQKLFSVCIKKLELSSERRYYRNIGDAMDIYAKQRELLLKYQGIDMGDGDDVFSLGMPRREVKVKSKRGNRGKKNKSKKRSTVINCSNNRGITPYRGGHTSTLQRLLFDEGVDMGDVYLDSSLLSEDSREAYDGEIEKTHNKIIYFYDNPINPSERLEFSDVHSFDEYCQKNHISLSDYECQQLLANDTIHCCVSPYGASMGGEKLLISDTSYGGLRWLCCSDNSELNEQALRYF